MNVEIHLTGLAEERDVDTVREQLEGVEGVEVHTASLTRIDLSYDQDAVDATEIQEIIERVGGEVLTMKPVE